MGVYSNSHQGNNGWQTILIYYYFFFCSIEIDFPDLRLKNVTKRVVFFFFQQEIQTIFQFCWEKWKKRCGKQKKQNKKLTSSTSAIGFCVFDQMRVWFEVRIVSKAELFLSLKKKKSLSSNNTIYVLFYFFQNHSTLFHKICKNE